MHPFYKEVVMGYCYSNAVDYEQFCTGIYRQSLWGNLFINVNVRRRKKRVVFEELDTQWCQ